MIRVNCWTATSPRRIPAAESGLASDPVLPAEYVTMIDLEALSVEV